MTATLPIGALAERTGVAPSALRFYEAEGLIHSTRSEGGQRRFSRDTIRRVSFVRVAQQVGLRLDEIREALDSLPENRTPTAKDWERLSKAWRPRLDAQIGVLERLRDRLDVWASIRGRHAFESRSQSFAVGVRLSGSESRASRISSSVSPTCWATRMNDTRRITSRW